MQLALTRQAAERGIDIVNCSRCLCTHSSQAKLKKWSGFVVVAWRRVSNFPHVTCQE